MQLASVTLSVVVAVLPAVTAVLPAVTVALLVGAVGAVLLVSLRLVRRILADVVFAVGRTAPCIARTADAKHAVKKGMLLLFALSAPIARRRVTCVNFAVSLISLDSASRCHVKSATNFIFHLSALTFVNSAESEDTPAQLAQAESRARNAAVRILRPIVPSAVIPGFLLLTASFAV